MAVGHRQRGDGRIDVVDARFHRLDDGRGGQARRGVALHVDRDGQAGLQPRYQLEGDIGIEDAGHVLDRHRVGAHVLDPLGQVDPHFQGVHRAGGVGNGALGMLADILHGLQRALEIARIVHRVEHAEHVHAIEGGTLDELVHHVIGIVTVAQQVLPAQQHLLRRLRHGLLQCPDALPGILTEIADAGVEGCAAPGFQRPETDLIELGRDRQHVLEAQAGGEDGLVRVTQHHIGNAERLFHVSHDDMTP
ncbi:hypothetical protein D9M71_446730 [compost metagenome]